ncbi:MAG: dephospho-CoA kinase [Bacteroidetes bacterium 43-16]|nr:MAG: dephospho-CoA kinase [Bacteroidetes bacterium 43-16]
MLKIGITGGIGSGKSVVTRIFKTLGIPTLDADSFAKELMESNPEVREQLTEAFGASIFKEGKLDRAALSKLVFNDKALLEKLNGIVHPAVKKYGNLWMEQQSSAYVVKEAALFFESGSAKDMDIMIGVSAPEALRLKRAMDRDNSGEADVRKRMSNQMDEAEKMSRCDYIVYNDEQHSLIEQIVHLHKIFLKQA